MSIQVSFLFLIKGYILCDSEEEFGGHSLINECQDALWTVTCIWIQGENKDVDITS